MKNQLEKAKFRLSIAQAMELARLHLNNFQIISEWKDAYPSEIYPLFTPENKEKASYYEIKISRSNLDDAGYIIISATEEDSPIPVFATQGRTLTERLRARSGLKARKIIWHGPNYVYAEDEKGDTIVFLGEKPEMLGNEYYKYLEKKGIEKSKVRVKRDGKTTEQQFIEEFKSSRATLQEKWNKVKEDLRLKTSSENSSSKNPSSSNPGLYLSSTDHGKKSIPYSNFLITYIDGMHRLTEHRRCPNMDQIGRNDPMNPNPGYPSGCGPTAWSALVAYFNIHWEPDLLYGYNIYMNDYIKRLICIFHETLLTGTEIPTTAFTSKYLPITWPFFMEYGYEVVKKHLQHDGEYMWYAYMPHGTTGNWTVKVTAHEMISDYRYPVIVLYRSGTYALVIPVYHYALGVGYAWGYGGPTDYIYLHKCHGNGDDDFRWLDVDKLVGVWAIQTAIFPCPRKKKTANYKSQYPMNMASLNVSTLGSKEEMEIYTVWHTLDNKIGILKAKASEYNFPVSTELPEMVNFSGFTELDQFNPFGEVSVCTWGYEPPITILPTVQQYSHIVHSNGMKKFITKEELYESKTLTPLLNDIIPYFFLSWRDSDGRIHIAYTIQPEGLKKKNFIEVVLPERFKTNIDPSITIAEPEKENLPIQVGGQKAYPTFKKGPFLYIAYCDPNPWANETSHFSPYGCLIVIRLETFFEIATTNQDLWPKVFMGSDFKPVTELVQVPMQVEVTVGFTGTQLWWPFCGPYYLKHVILKSCGNKVVLGWTSTTHLCIKNNPIFYSTDTNLWTDYTEYFDITRLSTRKPDIYLREVGNGVIGYCDQDGRISFIDFSSQGSDNQYEKHRLAHLLDTSASGVSLHYVTDKKGNRNIILGWFDNNNVMHHRLLFLLENPRDKSNLPV